MANGSRVSSHGGDTIHLLSSFSIDNVCYVLVSIFILLSISRLTCSLDCIISFIKGFFFSIQDLSPGQIIGTGCEYNLEFHYFEMFIDDY